MRSLALRTTVELDLAEYLERGRCVPRETRELPPLGDPSYLGVHAPEPGWRGTYSMKPTVGRFARDPMPWRDPMECDCAVCKPMEYTSK